MKRKSLLKNGCYRESKEASNLNKVHNNMDSQSFASASSSIPSAAKCSKSTSSKTASKKDKNQTDAQPFSASSIPHVSKPKSKKVTIMNSGEAGKKHSGLSTAIGDHMSINLSKCNIANCMIGENNCLVQTNNITIKSQTKKSDMASKSSSNVYQVSSTPKGYIFLFNIKNVKGLEERKGSEHDVTILEKMFKFFNFEVFKNEKDLSKEAILHYINAFIENKLDEVDSCGLCFMSHGNSRGLLDKNGEIITIESIISCFANKPHLQDKPKLFIFQVCRGDCVNMLQTDGPAHNDFPQEEKHIPKLAFGDFIAGYSTISGYQSFRNPVTGSPFISAIYNQFKKHAHDTDIASLTTLINQEVSESKLQQPEWSNALNKKWFF